VILHIYGDTLVIRIAVSGREILFYPYLLTSYSDICLIRIYSIQIFGPTVSLYREATVNSITSASFKTVSTFENLRWPVNTRLLDPWTCGWPRLLNPFRF
jgi:hypothetical protein